MGSVNRVILVGNLGRDAELRHTSNGSPVATLSVATQEQWRDKSGERQERTEWHRVVVWGKQADALAEYLTKGKQVYIEGQLQTRKWEDKDGQTKHTTEIRTDRIVLLGNNRASGERAADEHVAGVGGGTQSTGGHAANGDVDEDDIPF